MRLIYVPLEDVEQRYTKMMNAELKRHADVYLYPEFDFPEVIEKGQFLDVNKTIIFKSRQLTMIAKMFYDGKIEEGDIFIIGDIFFPGIESIRYMAELQGIKVQIYGFNYAGRADKTDFVQKLGKWADASEQGYHDICDGIFVGSENHKMDVIRYFDLEPSMVHVTGYIWDRNYVRSVYDGHPEKEDFVIFPHRMTPEKGVKELLEFAKNTNKKIIVTSSGNKVEGLKLPDNVEYHYNLTKAQYYETMARAKWYLSCAYQETFGYTLQEAIHFGCLIAVPNRVCYPEMVPQSCLYDKIEEIEFHPVNNFYTRRWENNAVDCINVIKHGKVR